MADTKEYEAFEANLKLNYEAVRKDLDIVLTSMIPTQKNLVKTYLWLNTSIIASIVAIYHVYGIFYGLLLLPMSSSVGAVIMTMMALYYGDYKLFGHIDTNVMAGIESDELEKVRGLAKMTIATKAAFDHNGKIITIRAAYLRKSLLMTMTSIVLLIVFATVVINLERKEVNKSMSNSKKEEVMLDTQKPSTGLSTNNTRPIHESYDHMEKGYGRTVISRENEKIPADKIEKKK